MNEQIFKGNWKQVKGKVKETWGKLTDDEIDTIAGNFDQLVGKVQEKYGYKLDEAKKTVNSFLTKLNSSMDKTIDKERH
ncbi:MAG: CsbD family protein [Bdellovibrionales bacterium]|nr:CsbD family protein [Bdellovibrionales bacterium]